MSIPKEQQRALLLRVARQEMLQRGLEPDFPAAALAEAERLVAPGAPFEAEVRDLRGLAWCSIDNDDSRDLDQLTVASALPGGGVKVMVAVADVSTLVAPGSAVDAHAGTNTTSIYTPPQNFPMLPERLSTDLTSLNPGEDRLAVVVETAVDGAGGTGASSVYRAVVRNHAKLAYSERGRLARGSGRDARGGRRRPGSGGRPPPPGPGGPASQGLPPRARGAGTRDDRGAGPVRRRRGERARGRGAQPREGDHRGLHDRRQRRHRPLPRGARLPGHAPGGALARALAADRRHRRRATETGCRPSPTRRPCTSSWSGAARRIRCVSPTSRSRSSSCSAGASTWPASRARM